MSNMQHNKVTSYLKQFVDGNYENIYIAPEQKFVKPTLGLESGFNNIEEELILANQELDYHKVDMARKNLEAVAYYISNIID